MVIIIFLLLPESLCLARSNYSDQLISEDLIQNPRYASIIINSSTGEVLHKYNADALRHPASLTKMMTAYVCFQAIKAKKISLNSIIPVSNRAAAQVPTKLWLKPGQKITVKDALHGTIIRSTNDTSVALAEAIAGTEDAFAYKMTQVARQLGMRNTTFKNATGLHSSQQVTTALDLAKLGIALRRDFPEFYPIFSKKSFIFKNSVINSRNKVLSRYKGADGLKNGYIIPSGFNLVTSASRPEGKIIAVVLGGTSAVTRDEHMVALLDTGFNTLINNKHNRHSNVESYNVAKASDIESDLYDKDDSTNTNSNVFNAVYNDNEFESLESETASSIVDKNPTIILASDSKLVNIKQPLMQTNKIVNITKNVKHLKAKLYNATYVNSKTKFSKTSVKTSKSNKKLMMVNGIKPTNPSNSNFKKNSKNNKISKFINNKAKYKKAKNDDL